MYAWFVLSSHNLDAFMLELICEFLYYPTIWTRSVMDEHVFQIFMALQRDCSKDTCSTWIDSRNYIPCISPHANHRLICFFKQSFSLSLSVFLVRESLFYFLWATPDKVNESLLACHHFGNISSVETINTVSSNHTLLPLLYLTFLCKIVSYLWVDTEILQILLIHSV